MNTMRPNPNAHHPGPAALSEMLYRDRRVRAHFFAFAFHEPAWDMLLDLERARRTGENVSIKSLTVASCVPPTTALRYMDLLEEAGLVERVGDPEDGRRRFVALTEQARAAMDGYLAAIEAPFASVRGAFDVQALLDLLMREAAKGLRDAGDT